MYQNPYHKFHIPVMGLAYTIDSPIKVACYGINSVMSIVEDRLIEMMRSYYYPTINQPYIPIDTDVEDYRAKRITDYLNLVNTIVQQKVEKIKQTAFEAGSEIVKYFEMLPEDSKLKQLYHQMMQTSEIQEKAKIEQYLRDQVKAGSIDVNIMTKLDRNIYDKEGVPVPDGSDAVTALRGYVNSDLKHSSIVFSAGLNPRLYNYLESCNQFDANEAGNFDKKVIIKVSDYRSALIQGKYLAKKGIWVSEFRVESGLNCGGHAFATDGYLMGPILEEFKLNRQELTDTLFEIYSAAQLKKNNKQFDTPPDILFTVQGGIGTHEEDAYLHQHYKFDSTGWGTPFLLVPDATTVDEPTLKLLCASKDKNVKLSHNSPLGVRFHYLKGTSSEIEKYERISVGNPGSPCTEKHLSFNTEFTKEPICTASKKYQKFKLEQLQSLNLPTDELAKQVAELQDKECLCVGLSNSAAINYDKVLVKKMEAVTICPGPNIVNFSQVVNLPRMVDHIYGRDNVMMQTNRPHMFIAELYLYIDYLKEQIQDDIEADQFEKKYKYYNTFFQNLRSGINYYREMPGLSEATKSRMLKDLDSASLELDSLNYQHEIMVK
jgi:heme oxygenase